MPLAVFANEGSFRGKNLNEILSSSIPISYANYISEQYNIPISQLNAQRGSYLIITPDNMIDHLGELISFKKSQGFDVYLKTLSDTGPTATEIKQLIENIILQSDLLDLKANFEGSAVGVILESRIDKGKGPVSTVLVTNGSLKKGNFFVSGNTWGKIRAMTNDKGVIFQALIDQLNLT